MLTRRFYKSTTYINKEYMEQTTCRDACTALTTTGYNVTNIVAQTFLKQSETLPFFLGECIKVLLNVIHQVFIFSCMIKNVRQLTEGCFVVIFSLKSDKHQSI